MDFLNTRVIKCFPAPLGHEPVLVIFHFFSCHKWSKKDVMDKPQINKQESFVKFTHSFFCFLHHFLSSFHSSIISSFVEKHLKPHSCIRRRGDNEASIFSGQKHAHLHTQSSEEETAEGCNRADEDHGVAVWFGPGWMFGSCETKTRYLNCLSLASSSLCS